MLNDVIKLSTNILTEYSIFHMTGPQPSHDLLQCPDPAAGAEVPEDSVPRTAGEGGASLGPGTHSDSGEYFQKYSEIF